MDEGGVKILIAVIIGFVLLKTCTDSREKKVVYQQAQPTQTAQWEKSPVDKLVQQMYTEDDFTIILHDMDVDNSNSSNPTYKHKYNVIIEKSDSVYNQLSDWAVVSPTFFNKNIDNLGMELASKVDGKLHKEVAPAGYSNYVGNPQYGQWRERNGTSFWEFYGRFAFMSSMFNLMTYPARRSYWNDYRGGYYGTGRNYYGPSGNRVYGTKSYTASSRGKSSTWASRPNSFKSNVRSKVSRSTPTTSSRSYSSSKPYQRTTRSSTRSYGGTSYRSRSGGYGK